MTPEAIIIQRPCVDFTVFLGAALKVLGFSLSATTDMSPVHLSDTCRFLSCLASMRDSKTSSGLSPYLLPHATYGILLVADEADTLDILERAAGMPFTTTVTQVRGVLFTVVTGNLAQWKSAVIAGSSQEVEPTVRHLYNNVHALFKAEGLNLWTDFRQKPAHDQVTYLLEDKRGR